MSMPEKSQWGPGPWEDEPDREEFEYRGYRCQVLRGPLGALNGYVALDPGHPAYRKSEDDLDVRVHGGLTFAGKGGNIFEADPLYRNDQWVLGFDCAHAGDFSPGVDSPGARKAMGLPEERSYAGVYRDIPYVKAELQSLVDQLIAIERKTT